MKKFEANISTFVWEEVRRSYFRNHKVSYNFLRLK